LTPEQCVSGVSVSSHLTELTHSLLIYADPCFGMDDTVSLLNKTCDGVPCTYYAVAIELWMVAKALLCGLYHVLSMFYSVATGFYK